MDSELTVRGARLAATVVGAGPSPFVWGHGLLSDRAGEDALALLDWASIAGVCGLVRYDARSHGSSSAATLPDELTWASLGQDMVGVADALGAATFTAGGTSMGCATALHAAVAVPERVRALVLVSPPTAWATRPAQARTYTETVELLAARPQQAMRLLLAGFAAIAPFGEVVAEGYPDAATIVMEQMRRLDPDRLPAVFAGAARSDLPDPASVADLDVPTLILAWDRDPGHPRSTAERLHELMEGSELHVAGSFDEVQGWSTRIARFLAAIA